MQLTLKHWILLLLLLSSLHNHMTANTLWFYFFALLKNVTVYRWLRRLGLLAVCRRDVFGQHENLTTKRTHTNLRQIPLDPVLFSSESDRSQARQDFKSNISYWRFMVSLFDENQSDRLFQMHTPYQLQKHSWFVKHGELLTYARVLRWQ